MNNSFLPKFNRLDILIVLILGVVFSCASYKGANLLPPLLISDWRMIDVWYQGDFPRNFEVMTIQKSHHHESTKKHPLYSLITYPLVTIIQKVLNVDPLSAARLFIAFVGFVWISSFYVLLRWMRCRRIDAVLFSCLGAMSAASMFWFVVPETFSLGSVTFLWALCFALWVQQHQQPAWSYFVINVITMSITSTNWMAGILLTVVNNSFKRAFQILTYAFAFVSVVWGIQKYFFPSAKYIFDVYGGVQYLLRQDSGGPLYILGSFFYHTLIMPAFHSMQIFDNDHVPDWPSMYTQLSMPGSATMFGMIAVLVWTLLIILGIFVFFTIKEHVKFRFILGGVLLGQMGFHMLYGQETFLYSLHFIVLLVPLVALGSLTKFRSIVIGLVFVLIPCVGINNVVQFNKALEHLKLHGTARDQVLIQKHFRPQDPWPRSEGHVVLAYPSTEELNKAYHEPGGSFSPSVGSFGVSIWVMDKMGKILATSDSIPLKDIYQEFLTSSQPVPGILSQTKYYQAVWLPIKPGIWRLELKKKSDDAVDLMLVVRSVGPAGGYVRSLKWTEERLSVNDRWILQFQSYSKKPYMGNETQKNWISAHSEISSFYDNRGWGFAQFPLEGDSCSMTIEDRFFKTSSSFENKNTYPHFKLSLPEKSFVDSLNAQLAHMMMGTVGNQTRPADPMEYPLSWQRHAAYIIVALAKAGELETARQLSIDLAKNDFFGAFGSEADALGLGIWALNEVASRLNNVDYDKWIWPHVTRKAKLIEKMLTASQPIQEIFTGPLVPILRKGSHEWVTLVATPSKDGLIRGRIGHKFSLLYTSAVSYLGLMEGASIAKRLNKPDIASTWRKLAIELQGSWNKAFLNITVDNPAAISSALWPTQVAQSSLDILNIKLKDRWEIRQNEDGSFKYDVMLTYHAVAEAHQWLLLGESDRVWKILQWFFKNQVSPGLYSWWETIGRGNTFNQWENVRGWVSTGQVTPNYWTSAEMLLLQLDMLAYQYPVSEEPLIIIGAGIPKEWLKHPMHVEGMSLPFRRVDWHWDGIAMNVKIQGSPAKVRLGSAFPENTLVNIQVKE